MQLDAPTHESLKLATSFLHNPAEPIVRVVDGAGALASHGLVQVQTDTGYGTVCGMNHSAADVVCRQMGFDHGVVSSTTCAQHAGSNVCGAAGSEVAMKDLQCSGHELGTSECTFAMPDSTCTDHTKDSVVYCLNEGDGQFKEGTLRLLDKYGAPSIDGKGRLEVFLDGKWAPVSSHEFTSGSASVACKQMGFDGARVPGFHACHDGQDAGLCGDVAPHSEASCSGAEKDVLSCPGATGDSVFSAPNESVVLQCVGHGDTTGRPAFSLPPAILT